MLKISNIIDARNLDVEFFKVVERSSTTYSIILNLKDGTYVGHIYFRLYPFIYAKHLGYSDNFEDTIENLVYINSIKVEPEFRNNGIAMELYKKFSEIYDSELSGYPVGREFVNPVAEYTYRKAVSLGLISETTIDEEYIKREYSEENKLKARDLRNKLPENVQGPENWASKDKLNEKFSATTTIDARDLVFLLNDREDASGKTHVSRSLNVKLKDGTPVGAIMYEEMYLYSDRSATEIKENFLYITYITVFEEFKNNGIGMELYKEFGKVYNERYNGWDIKRNFIEPVAEYLYRKAVSLGYFPEATLDEKNIKRTYDNEENKIKDLRNKLPENVRGPENWSESG